MWQPVGAHSVKEPPSVTMSKRSMESVGDALQALKEELIERYWRSKDVLYLKFAQAEYPQLKPGEVIVDWVPARIIGCTPRPNEMPSFKLSMRGFLIDWPYDLLDVSIRTDHKVPLAFDTDTWLYNALRMQDMHDTYASTKAEPHLNAVLPPDVANIVHDYLLRRWEREFKLLFEREKGHKRRKS